MQFGYSSIQPSDWLQVMNDYVLGKVLPSGCSKVKMLIGEENSGKTHLVKKVMDTATDLGYLNIYMDLHSNAYKLTNLASLYRTIAKAVPQEQFVKNLQNKMYENFGYVASDLIPYDGNILRLMVEKELDIFPNAQKRLRNEINAMVNQLDISFSHQIFLCRLMEELAKGKNESNALLFAWLRGEKLVRAEKMQLNLFETLKKTNARIWLYSLLEMLTFSGFSGMILVWDHFEAVYNEKKSLVRYTKGNRNDVYEILRQLIDDMDVLSRFLMVIASDDEFLLNEKFGAQSYHALWMRIVPTTKHRQKANPYADIIHVSAKESGFSSGVHNG